MQCSLDSSIEFWRASFNIGQALAVGLGTLFVYAGSTCPVIRGISLLGHHGIPVSVMTSLNLLRMDVE